ncbi:muscarinic acetylcholine receptor M2-like [Styela clava]
MNNSTTISSLFLSEENVSVSATISFPVIVAACAAAGLCSLLTVFGNFFVILAFITNRSLRNFSNYLILNLAISDIIIGMFSMNIYIAYNVNSTWTLGKGMCNAWLAVDYVVSNTSVMNLLMICIDRYMAITSPVKYRRRCTPKMAAFVICIAWTISILLWAPAILLWEAIAPPTDNDPFSRGVCTIPFMDSSAPLTLITAFGAFYFPAMAMCALYWRVIVKIERRTSGVSSMISRATSAMESRYTSQWSGKKSKLGTDKTGEHVEQIGQAVDENNDKSQQANAQTRSKDMAALLRDASLKYNQKHETKSSNRDSAYDKNSMTHLLKKEDTKSTSNAEISETPHSVTRSEEESFKNDEKNREIASPVIPSTRETTKHKRRSPYKKHSSNLSLIHRNNASRLNREKRATTLLKSILICFITLWLPYNVIVVLSALCGKKCVITDVMWILSYWLCYLNSTVNPFCYGYCNENFQRTFKALLTTKWWTKKGRRKMRCQLSGRNSFRNV